MIELDLELLFSFYRFGGILLELYNIEILVVLLLEYIDVLFCVKDRVGWIRWRIVGNLRCSLSGIVKECCSLLFIERGFVWIIKWFILVGLYIGIF